MSVVAHVRSRWGRKSSPRTIHPEHWPERGDKTRVLIEHPDGADLWAHADVLREAGYDVAVCGGPSGAPPERVPWFRWPGRYWEDPQPVERTERTLCPLVAEGHCPLAEGADVVVSSTELTDGREIVAALSGRSACAPGLVVEGTTLELKRYGDVIDGAVQIDVPVSPKQLVQAVERADSSRRVDDTT